MENIKKLKPNDVVMNIHNHETIVVKEICDGYIKCIWGGSNSPGSIPFNRMESPEWYSLMKEKPNLTDEEIEKIVDDYWNKNAFDDTTYSTIKFASKEIIKGIIEGIINL